MFFASVNAQDSLLTFTLEDVSIVDFKSDHENVFKNIELNLSSENIGLDANLEDALKKTIPIYFKNYSYGGISSIDFRGTGAERTQVYWNGMPLNSSTLGSFDFSLLPAFLIEEAKVRFGGASIVDGGGGIGGSIQLNQNTFFTKNKVEVIGSIGSFANYSGGIKAQIVLNKLRSDTRVFYHQGKNDFSFSNTSKKDHPIEKRENNELKRLAFQESLSYSFDENNSIEANFLYSALDRNIPSGISSSDIGAWQGDQLIVGQLVYNKLFANKNYFKIRSSIQGQNNQFKDTGIDADNKIMAWNNKIDWGGEVSNRINFNASFSYNYNEVNTSGTGLYSEQQYAALLSSDIQIVSKLSTSLGLRLEARDDLLFPLMPFIGLAWQNSNDKAVLKANFSRVYRYPTINERFWEPGGNPNLKPEEGWNAELGYELTLKMERISLQFQLTGFYSLINDWILWSPSLDNPLLWEAQNLWKVNSKGIEFVSELKWKLSNKLDASIRLLYTYTDSKVIGAEGENQFPEDMQLILVPKHLLFIPVSVGFQNLSLGLDYQFVSVRYTDRNNSNTLDPYHLMDALIKYKMNKYGITLSFRLKNIFNFPYQTYPGQPLPGINYNLQLSWLIK